jgi:hypothetical protein
MPLSNREKRKKESIRYIEEVWMSNGVKMVMITYNEAIDGEVMNVLKSCMLSNYTKLSKVYGKGSTSGTHLGNDIWPGLNNILYVACGEEKAGQLISRIKEVRAILGKEGVKAFVMQIEEMT